MRARSLGIAALVLGGVALVPSYAAFTPAVLLSIASLYLSGLAAFRGEFRWSGLAAGIAIPTIFVISPLFIATELRSKPSLAVFVGISIGIYILGVIVGLLRSMQKVQ